MSFQISKTVEDGIERIVYTPTARRFATPIVMQHGMWHGAWCWALWQEQFAKWGWETHAHSLPGHAGSPPQRPIRWCTLGYYLRFLTTEIERQATPPVLLGHSMGGALTQWYLKYVNADLPAAVLVAPWTSHAMAATILDRFRRDFIGAFLSVITLSATPNMRNPAVAARSLITEGAIMTPEELHQMVGPESLIVLFQHNPPYWTPPKCVNTPMLWIGAGDDAFFSTSRQRRSAAYYEADYIEVPHEGHNLMIERSWQDTARKVHEWLTAQGIE